MDQYLHACYFILTVFTTVGFGDTMMILPVIVIVVVTVTVSLPVIVTVIY